MNCLVPCDLFICNRSPATSSIDHCHGCSTIVPSSWVAEAAFRQRNSLLTISCLFVPVHFVCSTIVGDVCSLRSHGASALPFPRWCKPKSSWIIHRITIIILLCAPEIEFHSAMESSFVWCSLSPVFGWVARSRKAGSGASCTRQPVHSNIQLYHGDKAYYRPLHTSNLAHIGNTNSFNDD